MKKNKEWLKEELSKQINILHTTISSGNYVSLVKRAEILNLIDQLEEPEQKKVVIPQFVADRIEEYREIRFGLSLIFTIDDQTEDDIDFSKWLSADSENCEKVARAWLDGYTVEKEKRYTACFAPIGTRQGVYLYRESGSVKVGDNMKVYDKSKQEYHLTEQEIRNRDERFWAFAEEITK